MTSSRELGGLPDEERALPRERRLEGNSGRETALVFVPTPARCNAVNQKLDNCHNARVMMLRHAPMSPAIRAVVWAGTTDWWRSAIAQPTLQNARIAAPRLNILYNY